MLVHPLRLLTYLSNSLSQHKHLIHLLEDIHNIQVMSYFALASFEQSNHWFCPFKAVTFNARTINLVKDRKLFKSLEASWPVTFNLIDEIVVI